MNGSKVSRPFVWLVIGLLLWVAYAFLPTEWKLTANLPFADELGQALSRPYFHIGDFPVTAGFLLKALVFLLVLGFISGMTRRILQDRVLPRTTMQPGQQYALARVIGYLVFLIGAMIGLQSAGVNLNSVLLVGGAVGFGIGLGLQTIANNFISGLILLVEGHIRVGDRVAVGDTYGDVVRISARSTWVRTNDNVVIIVPNAEFVSERVTNWTANDRRVRFAIPVGVSYGSDPETVRSVLLEVARHHNDVLPDPGPEVLFTGFGDSALNFELRVWTIRQVQTPRVLTSDIYFSVFRAFRENGIEIPFPQRDLHLRSISVPIPVAAS